MFCKIGPELSWKSLGGMQMPRWRRCSREPALRILATRLKLHAIDFEKIIFTRKREIELIISACSNVILRSYQYKVTN